MDSALTQSYDNLTRIVRRFELVWLTGQPPSIADFLPPLLNESEQVGSSTRRTVLMELVLVDFEFRWKLAGDLDTLSCNRDDSDADDRAPAIPIRPRVEDYLAAFPELGSVDDPPVAVVCQEYYVRHRWGDRPSREWYLNKYPTTSEPLDAALARADIALREAERRSPAKEAEDSQRAPREGELPARIGRFRVERLLGKGAFGQVYLAYDEQLQRWVAVKVPHRERISNRLDVETYLSEARTVARLDHPHIVPVYDVGSAPDFPFYVVSKYVEGSDLALRLRQGNLSYSEVTELVATVAGALHHAHTQGFVHRDVKPSNILMDARGLPYVVDFGLALREEDFGHGPQNAGTLPYMSPEQARGEGHRVDGRSDIFSLGIVLYEMLTGRRPFHAASRDEWLEQINRIEVRPPRQVNDQIPKELERVCLKALNKRVSDRYTTASDMADDLRHVLAGILESAPLEHGVPQKLSHEEVNDPSRATELTPDHRSLRIVPKGLRSFDEHDADFFLELLPGPRDRDGLPESIRFWKTRIEEIDDERTFSVGVIYGCSGCGKSSFVKAGLLPKLAQNVLPVFVEATAAATEGRLLRSLRKHCPALPEALDLAAALAALRRGQCIAPGRKVLIVLDQFEQWLHGGTGVQNDDLVRALRQCDGAHLQCLLLVRDDFWMALTRFMRELEVCLHQGQNSSAVDLFDRDHAQRVLAAYGRAFGRMSERQGTPVKTRPTPAEMPLHRSVGMEQISKEQQDFLRVAILGLMQEDKVIPVRLALFAEMMKGKPWTRAALKQVGGTQGLGVAFLEETFSAESAPLEYRSHQQAARAVLRALLPDTGSDIKGQMRSRERLLVVSGYADHPEEFDELLRILDSEIHLITPVDPADKRRTARVKDESTRSQDGSAPSTDPRVVARYFQLTHDYLVHSLRDWLTRKQRETRRGRAEIRLAERAASYGGRPDSRLLPSWWEWAGISLLTLRRNWTPIERRVMRVAGRKHGLRFAGLAVLCVAMALGLHLWQRAEQRQANSLAEGVFTASADGLPFALARLRPLGRLVKPILWERVNDPRAHGAQRLNSAFALADLHEPPIDFLLDAIETAPGVQCRNLVAALQNAHELALPELKRRFDSAIDPKIRCRYAVVALQLSDPLSALENLSLHADPTARTTSIHEFSTWHGDLSVVTELMRQNDDSAFRSGLCAALGNIHPDSIGPGERDATLRTLVQLYTQAADGGTHSAAGWALRHWKQELPEITATTQPPEGMHWHVNGQGLTMLEVPIGTLTIPSPVKSKGIPKPPQIIANEQTILLADREVTMEQFLRFLDDEKWAGKDKPLGWLQLRSDIWAEIKKGVSQGGSDLPLNQVNWFDAVLYCNWLSSKEGLPWAYARTDAKWKEYDQWRCDPTAAGYRLPTELEWEYACRAGTISDFCFGNDHEQWLSAYAWYEKNSAQHSWAGGLKLPNGWGFFDMHGNQWEWCGAARAESGPPAGESALESVLRGGAFRYPATDAQSSHHEPVFAPEIRTPAYRFVYGFRPARTYP